jgi:hypothetical protein
MEAGANQVEQLLKDLVAAVAELDAVEADVDAFAKRIRSEV